MCLNLLSSVKCFKDIASELRSIFDVIVKMSALNENFHDLALSEYEARKELSLRSKKAEDEGNLVSLYLRYNLISSGILKNFHKK